jgi:hypothetical protein
VTANSEAEISESRNSKVSCNTRLESLSSPSQKEMLSSKFLQYTEVRHLELQERAIRLQVHACGVDRATVVSLKHWSLLVTTLIRLNKTSMLYINAY